MDRGHSKARMNVEDDRISMLPDELIHRILSFMNVMYAVRTSALSSRWRFIWTSMPYLKISRVCFLSSCESSKFVDNFLSHRNDQTEVYSVNLRFCRLLNELLFKRVLDYAFSHNIQQLSVAWLRDDFDFPVHLFRSQSLKYLCLTGSPHSVFPDSYSIVLASTWELPALTTLYLDDVVFSDDNATGVFSKCANLKNLTLNNFTILDSCELTVCHPQLSNLTLETGYWSLLAITVVAPQLKSLTIRSCEGEHLITAPNLVSLLFDSSCPLQFSTDLCFLEKVDLCIYSSHAWSGSEIGSLLQQLHNVKFLTLNLELVEPLSSCMEQISLQPSPFSNLKSLKIYPVHVPLDDEVHKKVTVSTEVLNYLLDGSPSATLTMISYEEIKEKKQKAQALANAVEAENRMSDLQKLLEKEKANSETLMGRRKTSVEAYTHDQGKTTVENMQLHFERKVAQLKRDVGVQINQYGPTLYILSQLHDIEVLLLKDVPTSKRDKLQECFSLLCAEADNFMEKALHRMKNRTLL